MATRRERIVLEVEDRGSGPLARIAAQAAATDRALEALNRRSAQQAAESDRQTQSLQDLNQHLAAHTGLLGQNTSQADRNALSLQSLNQQLTSHNGLLNQQNQVLSNSNQQLVVSNRSTQTLGNEFDRASGRVRLLLDALFLVGPAAAPIGAVAVPALTGLAAQAGIAVAAVGTIAVAFQGVGDAVKAVNEYALDPTGDNLVKMHDELSKLSPEASRFAGTIGLLRDQIGGMRSAAAGGFFPQFTDELTELDPLLARVQTLLYGIAQAAGVEVADGIDSLNSDRWFEFFDFLEREAGPTLSDVASIAGDVTHGFANMWMAFQPLNRDFGDWLAEQADDFDRWSSELEDSQGFQDFAEYVRDNGPRVAETAAAIAGAITDLVVAIAPLGGPVLEIVEALAKAFSAVADSDVGTPLIATAAAMTLLARATRGTQAVMGSQFVGTLRQTGSGLRNLRSDYQAAAASGGIWARQMGPLTQQMAAQRTQAERLRGTLGKLAVGGAALGGIAVAATGAADGLGITNTVSLGLMGLMAGPFGGAVGASVGALLDLSAASDAAAQHQADLAQFAEAVRSTLNKQTGAATESTRNTVQQRIAAEGLTDAAREQGLTMNDLTDAVMGSEAAVASLKATVAGGTFELYDAFSGEVREQQLTDEARAAKDLLDQIEELRGGYNRAQLDQQAIIDATGIAADRFDDAAAAVERLSTAWAAWTDQLDAVDAVVAYEQALDGLQESIATNGLTLDENTAAGQANLTQLTAIGRATQELVDSLPPAEKAAGLQQARTELYGIAREMGAAPAIAEEWARVAGLSASQVGTQLQATRTQSALLLDSFNNLPPAVQTYIRINGVPQTVEAAEAVADRYNLLEGDRQTLLILQKGAAESGVRRWIDLIRSLPPRTYHDIITRYRTEGVAVSRSNTKVYQTAPGGARFEADGGILSRVGRTHTAVAFAAGGFGDHADGHLPELTRPGGQMRIWSEPETKGEAYIPLADDWRRGRAESILGQVADIFGGRFEKYADGGLRAAERAVPWSGGPGSTTTTVVAAPTGHGASANEIQRAVRDGIAEGNKQVAKEINEAVRRGFKDQAMDDWARDRVGV
ncbi:hypothetical protein [Nocardioides sp. ChNu-99]|uniref:hypothetical protein n=1 Tax=Nocardioides sp. ChNu-99 TaxID=2839897 RepID=UPI0024066B43|nr:hypothetical protein [Nocardioides sp. ChNu-99]MDF9716034.1 hypothetical protein [Nocardioides sp. ChNu-99]